MKKTQDIQETEPEFDTNRYSTINSDYAGFRNVQGNRELVEFHDKTLHRIWLNNQLENYAAHWHSALEIIMPVENIYTVNVCNTVYEINPGEIFFIPPGEIHELTSPSTGSRFIFIMNITSITKLKGFTRIMTLLSHPFLVNEETCPNIYDDIYDLMIQIRNEYFNNREFAELSIQALLLNLFVKLGENYAQHEKLFPSAKPNKQREYIQLFNDALEFIDQNYTEDISLDYIAAQTGFSKFHFSRLFKQYTNYNFSDYLCFRRIKAAERLLESPDCSITDVAISSGFSSISTFNRLFKQQKGCTPSEYRRQNAVMIRGSGKSIKTDQPL